MRYAYALPFLFTLACGQASKPPCANEKDLAAFVEQEISGRLKAPSTAIFESNVVPDDDGTGGLVTGHVDAQNTFGAMIRKDYLVRVGCKDGQPYVSHGSFESKSWGIDHERQLDSLKRARGIIQ